MDEFIKIFVMLTTLILAIYYDTKFRRIPNLLTIPSLLIGVVISILFNGYDGMVFSVAGVLTGFAIFFIPFSMGGMGAGDVKLMAAIGSLMGWKLTVYSALLTAITGGIIVIGYTIYKGYFGQMFKNIGISAYKKILYISYHVTHNERILSRFKTLNGDKTKFERAYIPYGVAIAIGTFIVLIGNHFGYPPFI